MMVDVEESWRINALDPTTSVMKYYPGASTQIRYGWDERRTLDRQNNLEETELESHIS